MKKFIIVVLLMIMSIVPLSGCKDIGDRKLTIADSDVALLSIFSDNGKSESNFILRNYGHSFLSISNVSDIPFMVGDREVVPNETITIGLWNILEHFGVWYNVESNYISEYGKYTNRVSLTIGITLDDLKTISDMIDDCDKWTPLFNCSSFAIKGWNLVAEDTEKIDSKLISSPSYLVSQITKFEGYEKGRECTANKNVRYYKEG